MEQSDYSQSSSSGSEEVNDVLGSAASEFSKSIAEATSKLVGAAEQFSSMSTGLSNAVNEVKAASAKAQEAQKAAEGAKVAAEAIQGKIDRDYGNLKGLMSDLQERIAALAVLARPISIDSQPEAPADSNDNTSESSLESSSESASPVTENAPSPAGWQGWQG